MTRVMNYDGRIPIATPDQEAEVFHAAAEGLSLRASAERIFGHRRYKDRVVRILARGPREATQPDDEVEELRRELAELLEGDDPSFAAIVRAYKLRLLGRLKDPTARVLPNELLMLRRLENELETRAMIEQANVFGLTRPVQ